MKEYNGIERPAYTPDYITELKSDEVFVFGSNLAGMHGGGAAYVAFRQFGAVMGCGVGLRGQSYAIPTMQGGVHRFRQGAPGTLLLRHPHRLRYCWFPRPRNRPAFRRGRWCREHLPAGNVREGTTIIQKRIACV